MATQSFKDFLTAPVPTGKSAGSSSTQSFGDFLAKQPAHVPSFGDKAKTLGVEIAKGIVKPIATMVARPVQLAAELLGASDEAVNEFTKDKFGDWIAPTPQNAKDVYKDVGRGIETALTAGIGATAKGAITAGKVALPVVGKLAAEGAGYGLGASMEQGNKLISKETATNVALGAGLNVALPIGLQTFGKFLKGKGTKVAETVATPEIKVPAEDLAAGFKPSETPTYYHTTKTENLKNINEKGFNGEIGDMSKMSGGIMEKGVFLYPEKSSAEVFGKNFKNPSVIETKVDGKIYDANTQTKYGWEDNLQTQEIAKDKNIINQLKKDGYVGVKSTELGTDAIFVFKPDSVKLSKSAIQNNLDDGFKPSEVQPATPTIKTDTLTIDKSIPSLEQEAKKYKSAEEFVKAQNWKQKGELIKKYGNEYEYHLSTEPNLEIGKTFKEQKTIGEIGKRGQSMGEGIYTTKNPQYWESQLAYEANGEVPKHLYLVRVKNGQKSGMLESGFEAQTLNKADETTIVKKILTNDSDAPLDIGLAESVRDKEILTDIWKKSQTKTPESSLISEAKTIAPTIKPEPIQYTPPKQKELVDDVVRKMEEKKVPVSEFEHQTNLGQAEAISKMDQKEVIDIALGRKPSPNQVPREAYYTFVEDLADKAADAGDTSLAMELSKSDIPSLSGQAFQALSATNKDSLTGMIRDIRAGITNKIPYAERQVNRVFNDIKSVIDKIDTKTMKPTKQAIIEALEAIKCK